MLADGDEMPFDLFLGVPVHRAPAVVEESGLAVDGWIPVDPLTLETRFPGVYAVGDVTSVGTPKAGVFAEGQAAVVADRILARHPRRRRRRRSTTETASAISSSGTDQVARWTSRSSAGKRRRGIRRSVADARRRQGGIRRQPDPPLVRLRVTSGPRDVGPGWRRVWVT